MQQIKNILTSEPVLVSGVVEALIVLLVAFGLDLTVEQTGAILGFVAVATSFAARAFVSPSES